MGETYCDTPLGHNTVLFESPFLDPVTSLTLADSIDSSLAASAVSSIGGGVAGPATASAAAPTDGASAMHLDDLDLCPGILSKPLSAADLESFDLFLTSILDTLQGEVEQRPPKRRRDAPATDAPATDDVTIAPYALKKAQLEKFFLVIGMASRDTRKVLAARIAALPDAPAFAKFVTCVLAVVTQFTTVLEDGRTKFPAATDFLKIRTHTRSHRGMEANPLFDKLRGSTGDTHDGRVKGTAFQELQDDGSWCAVVTKTPSFSRCIRYEVLVFLDEFDIDAPMYRGRHDLVELIGRLKTFFSPKFFEAVLAQCDRETIDSEPAISEFPPIPTLAETSEHHSQIRTENRIDSHDARSSSRKRKEIFPAGSEDNCRVIFVRDLRVDHRALARPKHLLLEQTRAHRWTAKDVVTQYGPDDSACTVELYTVDVHCSPVSIQAGQRLSGNLLSSSGPLPLGHLELVMGPQCQHGVTSASFYTPDLP